MEPVRYSGNQIECLEFMESFKKGDTIHWYRKNPGSVEVQLFQSFKGFLHSYDIFYNEIRFIYKTPDNKSNHRIYFFEEDQYNASICRLILIEKEFKINKGYPI